MSLLLKECYQLRRNELELLEERQMSTCSVAQGTASLALSEPVVHHFLSDQTGNEGGNAPINY